MEEMTQSVTVPISVELAPQLEELAGLGSQIVRSSCELQTMFQSDLSGSSASVCALLPVMLSNAQNCISLLQFTLNQAPTSLPPPSPLIPPSVGPLSPSPVLTESDHSGPPTGPLSRGWGSIRTRLDTPVVDPRFSIVEPSLHAVRTPYLPVNSSGIGFLPRSTTPATQSWPLPPPPIRTIFESSVRSTLGGHSNDEASPASPLLHATPTRHSVSIAELVDEESTSPDTRGGVNAPRPTVACTNVPTVHSYPPLRISVIDVFTRGKPPTTLGVSQIKSLRSSSSPPPKTPDPFTAHASAPSPGRAVPSASSNLSHIVSEGGKTPRRSRRKRASVTTHEIPEGRVTRGSIKRKAADDSEMGDGPSKRMKPSPF